MAARKKPRQHIFASHVPTAWRWVIGVAAGIAAIATAITMTPKAVDVAEPFVPSTRGYTRDTIAPVDQKAEVSLYWHLQDQKAKQKTDEGGWSVQLQKEKDPAVKEKIQKLIEHAKDEQTKLDARVQRLKVPDWIK